MKLKLPNLAIAAVAAFGLALTGCDKPADPAAEPAKPAAEESADAKPAKEKKDETADAEGGDKKGERFDTGEPKVLNLFCWSEYVPDDIIEDFTKTTGIKVNVQNYASNEEMLAKLMAGGGNFDLIQPSEYVVEALIKDDALRPLDPKAIPNLKNLAPEFRELAFDPGNKYSVPWMAGTVGIVVNTELVTEPVEGFVDVFQEKYAGNIVVLDDAREIVSWAFMTEGIPVNDVTDENLEKVKPLLSKWLPMVRVFDSDSPKTALQNGDVALGIVWSGEGAILVDADKKFKWVLPKEGTHLFVDSLVIPKTAEHPKNAEVFMNYILRPGISKRISEEFPYLNPNLAGRELLTEEQLANAASFPSPEEVARLETFEDIGEQAGAVDDLITTIKVQ